MSSNKSMPYNIRFQFNPMFEFEKAASFAANRQQYVQLFKEAGQELESAKIAEEMEAGLSRFLREELAFFFGHPLHQFSLGSGCMVQIALDQPSPPSVPEGLRVLEQTDGNELVAQMVKSALREQFDTYLAGNRWEQVKHDRQRMLQLLNQFAAPAIEIAERLRECLNDPEETKQRFLLLSRRFYETIYYPFEERIRSSIKAGEAKYKQLYEQDPERFLEYCLLKADDPRRKLATNVHISFFDQACCVHDTASAQGETCNWIRLGIHVDRFLGMKPLRKQVDLFLKLLSDPKRTSIVEALAERPCYAQELSKKMNLTPAAISYHMSFFHPLSLVRIQKMEQRHYYLLDKEKVKRLFSLTETALLKE